MTMVTASELELVDGIVSKMFEGDHLNATNWTRDGECEPWLFDGTVFSAADEACRTTRLQGRDAIIDTGERTQAFFNVLEALREWPGGRDFATASLIVAMYRHMETFGFED
ncbi:MAG TPA: hypothetical protein VLA88_02190 [Candidatus Saccharimonadales bacterium]|nr:hypothetical protein [Candidatus Saccharimonadales bacterium]